MQKIDPSKQFFDEVYSVVREIPRGKVLSYGQIAKLIGFPNLSRMVGRAMQNASSALPCHRVVNSQGRIAPGCQEHHSLLLEEGVKIKANGCVDMKLHTWEIIKEL